MQYLHKASRSRLSSLLHFARHSTSCRYFHTGTLASGRRFEAFPVSGRTHLWAPPLFQQCKRSIGSLDEAQVKIDALNDRFVEARDEIEYAQEDAETTYFNESHQLAKEAVSGVMDMYQEILSNLSDADKGRVQRSMGMKMEQLKAELGQLDTLHS